MKQDYTMACFPAPDHDHRHCVARVLGTAEHLCAERQVRLTAQRRRVLEIIAASHTAIGAYEIMDRLGEQQRRPAPISVYRALDFLIAQRLVHRLASRNAYIACATPRATHGAQFLICERCGAIGEVCDDAVEDAIAEAAHAAGFAMTTRLVEVAGLCAACSREVAGCAIA
jgi:Fur family transcriptional regulator, zinc uptake regulator